MKVELLKILACPDCKKGPLILVDKKSEGKEIKTGGLECRRCHRKFPIKNKVPYLLPKEFNLSKQRNRSVEHKIAQVKGYSTVDCSPDSLHVNIPHCHGEVGKFLFNYPLECCKKFLGKIKGKKILNVCCGRGAEAEYFSTLGADLLGLDISPEFLRCSIVRSKKYGFDFDVIVGDAEKLPIMSKSFDYGLVRDGLHHLPNPYLGIQELSRISRKGIIITESFETILTQLLVKIGISYNTECGVPINRFDKRELLKSLKSLGFNEIKLKCFYVYMHSKTPKVYKIFDNKKLWRVAEFAFKLLNITGKIGNRFVLVAERSR